MIDQTTPARPDRFPRIIAFYLTQFHPIPENDKWWGKGFTEWTNVTKAQPLFDGHYQPHLPADLGFYDLRVRETRHEQIRLAKEYGIDGFCYHYYWFSGTRLLNQPLDDMLADPESDMPFCLCWANENWTRRWDAAEHEILIAQRYLPDDDLNFIRSLAPFLTDPRYIRVGGAPFLIVYRPQHLPDARKTVAVWRDFCRTAGIGEIHVCAALTHGNQDYAQFGFDSGVEFPPHNLQSRNLAKNIAFRDPFAGYVVDYREIATTYLERRYQHSNVFRGVFPAWDNTPRTGSRGVIVMGTSPENYECWLAQAIERSARDFPEQERLVFINAWNEWAEGCHLEPDRRYQRRYLEATLAAKCEPDRPRRFVDAPDPALSSEARRRLLPDLGAVLAYHFHLTLGRLVGWLKGYPRLRRFVRWVLNGGR
ncbi:MAG: glycoside hydrolase family 99-like domain-containing protein [Denitratisoma sp.]|nr:glycoside hydrolase family 99-like domain-containing protein [Denitratisoma sp.]